MVVVERDGAPASDPRADVRKAELDGAVGRGDKVEGARVLLCFEDLFPAGVVRAEDEVAAAILLVVVGLRGDLLEGVRVEEGEPPAEGDALAALLCEALFSVGPHPKDDCAHARGHHQ